MTAVRMGAGKPWIGLSTDMANIPATPPGQLFCQTDQDLWFIADTAGNWQDYNPLGDTELPPGGSSDAFLVGPSTSASWRVIEPSDLGGSAPSSQYAQFLRGDLTWTNELVTSPGNYCLVGSDGIVGLGFLVNSTNSGLTPQASVGTTTNHSFGIFVDNGTPSMVFTTDNGVFMSNAPTATANYGLFNLGAGAWDGASSGHFAGNANGTHVAVNAVSGYAGRMLDLQIAGSRIFGVGKGTVAASSTAIWNAIEADAFTTNITGVTATIAPTNGFSYISFQQPTVTATNAQTIAKLVNVAIYGAPIASTNVTATWTAALWVEAGLTELDGGVTLGSGTTLTLTGTTVAGAPTWSSGQTFPGLTIPNANTLALGTSTVSGTPTWSSNQAITLSTAAQPNVTSLGTLTTLAVTDAAAAAIANNTALGLNTTLTLGNQTAMTSANFNSQVTIVGSSGSTVTAGQTIPSLSMVNITGATYASTTSSTATLTAASTLSVTGPTAGAHMAGNGYAATFVAGSGFGTNYALSVTGVTSLGGSLYCTDLDAAGAGTALVITAGNDVVPLASQAQYKTALAPLGGTERLFDLHPVSFTWNERSATPGRSDIGLVAEDVARIYPELATYDRNGSPFGVKYMQMVVPMLSELSRLRERVAQLEATAGGAHG